MLKLINRLSLFLSIIMGFLITLSIATVYDVVDFDDDTFLVWVIFVSIFAFIFKRIFLSRKYIESVVLSASRESFQNDEAVIVADVEESDENNLSKDEAEEEQISVEGYTAPTSPAVAKSESTGYGGASEKLEMEFASDDDVTEAIVQAEDELVETSQESEAGYLSKFFAENTLAKIGGILLFLGVLFLLQLVYTSIGPVGKLLIGFSIGFVIFGVAVLLDKKSFKNEARILLGISILINYLVILSGRYLISGAMTNSSFLGEGVTFFFLILNTVFAVSTALVYRSKALLFFAFIAAYLNPFLVGYTDLKTPYTYIFYSLCVSLGSLVLSRFYRDSHRLYSVYLSYIAFIGGNLLFLVAPFTHSSEWILKLCGIAVLSILCILNTYFNKNKAEIAYYILGSYLFFVLLLIIGAAELGPMFRDLNVILSYLFFISIMIFVTAFYFVKTNFVFIICNLIFPLLIIFSLFGLEQISFKGIPFILVSLVILYLGIFALLRKDLGKQIQYVFFGSLGVFIFLVSLVMKSHMLRIGTESVDFSMIQSGSIIFVAILFLLVSYGFSAIIGLEYLYFMATVFSIFIVVPILNRGADLRLISILCVLTIIFSNLLLPFINSRLLKSNIKNIVFGLVAGVLFLIGEVYYFLYGDMGSSKMTLGLVFLCVAILYFFLSYAIMLKTKIEKKEALAKGEESNDANFKNIIYLFLGISISIFSLAIAFIFSTNHEIITIVWLLEASVLYYFYGKTMSEKVFTAAFILMSLGIAKLLTLINLIDQKDYSSFVPLFVIFASSLAALYFIRNEKRNIRYLHDSLHSVILLTIFTLSLKIIPNPIAGCYIFASSVILLLCSICYSLFFTARVRYFFLIVASLLFLNQVASIESFFNYIDREGLFIYRILHYLSTVVFIFAVYLFNTIPKKFDSSELTDKIFTNTLNVVTAAYFFVITTQYVYLLFAENPFVVTIYWGVFAFAFLYYGIASDVIKYRTAGLYVLVLAVGKILMYDIWSGLDDAILRVVALMVVGVLMISISLLYTKKYGGNLKGEFDFSNLGKGK